MGTLLASKIQQHIAKYNGYVSRSVQVLIDLETFDNGDELVVRDGVDILVTDAGDYQLPELNGFPVGTVSAVHVKTDPVVFDISKNALKNLRFQDRKCIDPVSDLNMKPVNNYSLSNCLVESTLSEIYKK